MIGVDPSIPAPITGGCEKRHEVRSELVAPLLDRGKHADAVCHVVSRSHIPPRIIIVDLHCADEPHDHPGIAVAVGNICLVDRHLR